MEDVADQVVAVSDDPDEFSAWVAPHWTESTGLAHRLVDRADVEDVVQETLLLAWRKRHRYRADLGSPRAWLLALTADQARRSRRRRRPTPVVDADPVGERDTHADVDLLRAVSRLTRRQRLAVELYYYLDLPVAEIAEVTACSVGTVKSTLSDARGRLRSELGKDYR